MRLNSVWSIAVSISLLSANNALAAEAAAIPAYVEETATSGLSSIYAGDWEQMVGGGVATFDCNADGYPDMVTSGGTAAAKFYRNASTKGGALKFEAEVSGLELDKVSGTYPLDIDSDGITDLVLLRVGENVLMRGLGGCKFERANEAFGFDGGDAWSAAFAATFEKGAALPTLAVGNYINRAEEFSPWGSCTDNWLHRPLGTEQKFAPPVALKPSFCALSMLFTDWNRSGLPALRVSNDREYYEGGTEQLWHVEAGKEPKLFAEEEGWQRLRIWGMGIAAYDLDFDGFQEYFHTSMADNKLQALAAPTKDGTVKPTYKDIAFAKGVTAHRPFTGDDLKPSTAWHAQFEDVNNDSLADLFVAKGNVDRMPDFAGKDPNNLLIQEADGKFTEAAKTSGVWSTASARGGAVVDLNLDGLLDLVVINRREPAQVWRNTSTNAGRWLQVRLQQADTNRDAIGAFVEVKRIDGKIMSREITSGGGQASGSIGWWHFGLGDVEDASMRVIWPDGTEGEWESLVADSFYVLSKGEAPAIWEPK
ncbi:MAG: CRTAC1 family protein [Rhizobiaceae bacterium]